MQIIVATDARLEIVYWLCDGAVLSSGGNSVCLRTFPLRCKVPTIVPWFTGSVTRAKPALPDSRLSGSDNRNDRFGIIGF
ncbi:hypothetical protein BaRGS_00023146 [Batillaria attramentaria]|uniref:Uncharacterized protein n=1 Tax=Batillaria attramentaria TaxID=370345 RepID=A0ABD0KEX0_9CAEN